MQTESSQNTRIVALAASPSKGWNSDSMLDAFIQGIHDTDASIVVQKHYVVDIPIDMYSYENRECAQPHEKEFSKLLIQIQNAQGLIIATPTYNFSVPAGLKNLIDRMRCIALDMNKKNTFNQPTGLLGSLRTYFLVSGGTPRWAQKILFFAFPPFWLRSVFLYYGAKCLGAFYSGDVTTHTNEKILMKCRKYGRRYARKVLAEHGNNILEQIFWRPPQR